LFVFVLLAVAILALPAFAQTCLQDRYNQFVSQTGACTSTPSSNTLNCTANDVGIAQIPQNSIHVISGGTNNPPSCFTGGTVTFTADYDILTTANAAKSGGRDNVGLYLASLPICGSVPAGQPCNPAVAFGPGGKATNAALCGQCSDNIISDLHDCGGAATGTTCGSDNYHERDAGVADSKGQADNCGDTSSVDNSSVFGAGSEGTTFLTSLTCGGQTCTVNGTTGLLLNYCASWQTPGSAIACHSDTPAWAYPFDPTTGKPEAVPGTVSKCNCSTVCLPITPINPSAKTAKACNTPNATPSSLATTTSPTYNFTGSTGVGSPATCDAGVEGSTATYYVAIKNTTGFGGIAVDQVCDSYYGTIYDDNYQINGTRAFPVCSAGTGLLHGAQNIDCPPSAFDQTGVASCTFTAPVGPEAPPVLDTVTTAGHSTVSGQGAQTFSNSTSNQVTVTSDEAPSTATVTKSWTANEAACVTVRYGVDVHNTGGFDETLDLSGLNDNPFGDITTCKGSSNGCTTTGNANILGTTCGVAPGIGTLAGVTTDSGAFSSQSPFTLAVSGTTSHYVCHFDAQFCGPITTLTLPGGGTCAGISHSNTVSATLALDASETGPCTDPVTGTTVACKTETDTGVTVYECISETSGP
jgi:hypothetical protein